MVLWSLATTAAYAQAEDPTESRTLNSGAAPASPAPSGNGNGLRLRLPPVYWTGRLGFDISYNRIDGEPTRQYRLLTAGVGAATYLYAPWAATLSGSLNLTKGVTLYDDALSSKDNNEFATGTLALTLFPRSRFPTEMRYEVSDTRLDSTLGGGVDYRTTLIALNQRYRPANNGFTVVGSYERRTQDGLSFGRDTQDYYLLDYATSWKRQQLNATLTRNYNRTEGTGEETDFMSIFARHSYYGDQSLTIDSGASWTHSDDQLRSGDRTTTAIQLASVAVWNSMTMPLTVTGSARALSFQQDQSNDSSTLAAGVGATYEFSPNARVGGSVQVTRFDEQTAVTTTGQISGNYQGDTVKLGPVDWNWYAGAGLGLQSIESRFNANLSGQIGQTLNRTWITGGSSWSASLGQTLSASVERRKLELDLPLLEADRVSRAVTNTLALSWTRPTERGSAMARLSLADARQLDREQSRFQQANFQLSGTHELDRYRRWNADFTVQYNTQSQLVLRRGDGLPALPVIARTTQDSQNASGEIGWYQDRMFNVPRLNFSSRLRVSLSAQKQSEQLVPLPDRDLASWENRLDYRIGRLESAMVLRVSRVDDRQQVFAMWRLQRTFGG